MYLKQLNLHNFKNYTSAELTFSPKVNCFIGDNASGKTNILDAIYYLSLSKSYFNLVDSQNIRHGEEYFSILGKFEMGGETTDTIHCIQKLNQKKSFKLNKKEYQRLADHIGLYPLVMVSPYDRDLINEGSEVRRRLIDSIISQFDKLYLDDLINYNKALAQRNVLLKTFAERHFFDQASIEIWDEQLIQLAQSIYPKRRDFLQNYLLIFNHYFGLISGGKETVDIVYETQLAGQSMGDLLAATIGKDRIMRYTTTGIHKDDLVFNLEGYPVKKFGSQGQQKSFILAIRLAQYEYIKQLKGYKPVMLLDDIFDKLDNNRVEQIIKLTSENSFGQVFITDTQRERISHMLHEIDIDHKIFEIKSGEAFELQNHDLEIL
jgi:DNA replication and repair protein RecF